MNVFLWIVQIALAAAFLLAGVMKATQPKEKLQPKLPWVEDFSAGTVRLIGVAELLGCSAWSCPPSPASPRCSLRSPRPAWRWS